MKMIIYVKNSNNQFIGTYKLNEDVVFNKNNLNKNILKALYESLNKIKVGLSQFKCLGKTKDSYFFLVGIKTFEEDLSLEYFTKLVDSKEEKISKRMLKKYQKKIKEAKLSATLNAFFSNFGLKDFIILFIEITVLVISIVLKLDESELYILILSVVLLLINSIRKIINTIFKVLEYRKSYELSSNYESKDLTNSIKKQVIDNYKKSHKYKDFDYLVFKNGEITDNIENSQEIFIYSDLENQNLKEFGASIKVLKNKYRNNLSDDSRNALAYVISNKLNYDKTIFNGHLIGINSDLNFKNVKEIEIKDVRYHNYVSADEMIYRNIKSATRFNKVIKGTDICLNPITKGLNDIENSHLTNLIGVNLIIELHVNNKEYLIINQQSMYNDVNNSRLVPTSSGSLDKNDYIKFRLLDIDDNLGFEKLLSFGMLRELSEESYLDFEIKKDKIFILNNLDLQVKNFHLLGVSRLVSKAGKPDFFGKLVLESNDPNIINKILENYDRKQNEYLGTKQELETTKMIIEEKEVLLDLNKRNKLFKKMYMEDNKYSENENEKYILSPQLSYVFYLLENEK